MKTMSALQFLFTDGLTELLKSLSEHSEGRLLISELQDVLLNGLIAPSVLPKTTERAECQITQQPFHRSPSHPAGSAGPDGSAPPPVNHTNT